jgi:hypothetical protein
MNSVLILYPVQPYVNSEIFLKESPEINLKYAEIYQELLRARYPGFQLVCVMFSEQYDPEKPDLSQPWQGFDIRDNDIVGSCGVSFNDLTEKRKYPKPKKIISLCPEPIEQLVIGGFHRWDCVDSLAKYAYKKGINVSVDEDLTEMFFFSVRDSKGIPVAKIPVSKELSIKMLRKQLREAGHFFLKGARDARKNKPWMYKL